MLIAWLACLLPDLPLSTCLASLESSSSPGAIACWWASEGPADSPSPAWLRTWQTTTSSRCVILLHNFMDGDWSMRALVVMVQTPFRKCFVWAADSLESWMPVHSAYHPATSDPTLSLKIPPFYFTYHTTTSSITLLLQTPPCHLKYHPSTSHTILLLPVSPCYFRPHPVT